MKTSIVVLVLSYFVLFKLSEAHVTRIGKAPPPSPGPMPTPTAPPPQPTSTSTPPTATPSPLFDRITPKCYPETAKAYFLPAPPSSPKVTVLDHNNLKDLPASIKSSLKEMASSSTLASNIISNHPSFAPPPTPVPVLPDLIDEIPTLVQDRFSRLAESDGKVCDVCASMIESLPIFKFDKELLDGFLVGLGI